MKDNKLGIMPISKLIWNMSLPIICLLYTSDAADE